MKLTWEETKEIANRLDEIISNNFHDAMYNVITSKMKNNKLHKMECIWSESE